MTVPSNLPNELSATGDPLFLRRSSGDTPDLPGSGGEPNRRARLVLSAHRTLLREGLRFLLPRLCPVEVIGEASTGSELVEVTEALRPDMVLLDVGMAGRPTASECVRRITAFLPELRVVALAGRRDLGMLRRVLEERANGAVHKDSGLKCLTEGVSHVAQGLSYFCPQTTGLLRELIQSGARSDSLSDREREILVMLAEGRSAREIAEALGLSRKTVENHRFRIMKKLSLHRVVDLTRYAVKSGLLSV